MADVEKTIHITVDGDALKEQVGGIIDDALKQAAERLRFAADFLDPDFMPTWERVIRDNALSELKKAGWSPPLPDTKGINS